MTINKHILLGVSGGIAAYKSAELVRLFKKQGAEVQVVMTKSAMQFVSPLTFQALSGNPVHSELLDANEENANQGARLQEIKEEGKEQRRAFSPRWVATHPFLE